jgi:hypothetical protein
MTSPYATQALRSGIGTGSRVQFEDKSGATVHGTVTRMNEKRASVTVDGGARWRVGYSLLRASSTPVPAGYVPPATTRERLSSAGIQAGSRVEFTAPSGARVVGTVVRINRATASMRADNGSLWRVGPAVLRREDHTVSEGPSAPAAVPTGEPDPVFDWDEDDGELSSDDSDPFTL